MESPSAGPVSRQAGGWRLWGAVSLFLQVAVIAIVTGSVGVALVGALAVAALVSHATSGAPLSGAVRRSLPVAGLGGLGMLAGPGLDLARSRPPGTHAGWSLLLMVGVCWWACKAEDRRMHRSGTWALSCRICAVIGMLAGMAMVHSAMVHFAMVHSAMAASTPVGHAAGFALSHVAMVSAMTLGSSVGFAVPLWLDPGR